MMSIRVEPPSFFRQLLASIRRIRTIELVEPLEIKKTDRLLDQCEVIGIAISKQIIVNLTDCPLSTLQAIVKKIADIEIRVTNDSDIREFAETIRTLLNELNGWTNISVPMISFPDELHGWKVMKDNEERLTGEIRKKKTVLDITIDRCEHNTPILCKTHGPKIAELQKEYDSKSRELGIIRKNLAKYRDIPEERIRKWLQIESEWNKIQEKMRKTSEEALGKLEKCRYKLGNLLGRGNEGKVSTRERMEKLRSAIEEYIETQTVLVETGRQIVELTIQLGTASSDSKSLRIDSNKITDALISVEAAVNKIIKASEKPVIAEPEIIEPVMMVTETNDGPVDIEIVIGDPVTPMDVAIVVDDGRQLAARERRDKIIEKLLRMQKEVAPYLLIIDKLAKIASNAESRELEAYIKKVIEFVEVKRLIEDGLSVDWPENRLATRINTLAMEVGIRTKKLRNVEDAIVIIDRIVQNLTIPKSKKIFMRLMQVQGITEFDKVTIRLVQAEVETTMQRQLKLIERPNGRFGIRRERGIRSETFEQFYARSVGNVIDRARTDFIERVEKNVSPHYLRRHIKKHLGSNGRLVNRVTFGDVTKDTISLDEERRLWRTVATDPSGVLSYDNIRNRYGDRILDNERIIEVIEGNVMDAILYVGATMATIENGQPFIRAHFLPNEREIIPELLFLLPIRGDYLLAVIFDMLFYKWETTFITKWEVVSDREKSMFFAPVPHSLIR